MKEIDALFDTYQDAVLRKDIDAFTSIFADDIYVFDMWKWTYEGLAPWREMVQGWFSSLGSDEKVMVTFEDISIRAEGEMAVATAFARFVAVSDTGEELRYLQNRLTWVAQKKEGVWKIIHEHTSGPADGATMQIRLKR